MACHLRSKSRHYMAGQSVVELALIMPILIILFMAVADFSRAILFNNILINLSREGANLASRTAQSPQFIIAALSHTSAPLEMETRGEIFLSRIKGVDNGSGLVIAVVDEQYRSASGDLSLLSRLWQCPAWESTGKCTLPAAASARVVTLPFALELGYEIHVAEATYTYNPLTNFFFKTSPQLYSVTYL